MALLIVICNGSDNRIYGNITTGVVVLRLNLYVMGNLSASSVNFPCHFHLFYVAFLTVHVMFIHPNQFFKFDTCSY